MNTETKKFRPYTVADYNAGKVPVYRNGEKPMELHFFKHCEDPFPFTSILPCGSKIEHTKTGTFDIDGDINDFDLVIECEKREYWINVFKGKNNDVVYGTLIPFTSKEMAMAIRKETDGFEYLGDPVKIGEEYI